MIVIRLRPFVLAAVALAVGGTVLTVTGDAKAWYLLAHVGLMVNAGGIAMSVVAWIEKRLASVEAAFLVGAKLREPDDSRYNVRSI